MIVVKIELWTKGDEKHKKEIGRTYIFNDGINKNPKRGNYEIRVCRKGNFEPTLKLIYEGKECTRTAYIKDFPRKSYNVWRLITRALKKAFPEEK